MSKIRIKNFGPIKEGYQENDGWLDVKKVTVFIGNQGSGKSTVAKVISSLTWMEKALNREDFSPNMSRHRFELYFIYQNLKGYFRENTIIEYQGDRYSIEFNPEKDPSNPSPIIKENKDSSYTVPKIMYVPDSRNFLSVIKNATGVRGIPDTLFEFAEELKRGQIDISGKEVPLPINGVFYKYIEESDTSFIIGKDYRVNLTAASSGFQSLVPLYLVSSSLARIISNGPEISPANMSVDRSLRMQSNIGSIMLDNSLTDNEKLKKADSIKAKFVNKAFINIVEEPEQNLFPSSQQKILNSLLEFNNMSEGNSLIITTHSPYMVNFISIAIQADHLQKKISNGSPAFMKRLEKIIPLKSLVSASDVVIYQLNENEGVIRKLPNPEGIPSDKNYLNQFLRQGNEMFDSLLEIEQEL